MRQLSKKEIQGVSGGCGLLGAVVAFKVGLVSRVLRGLFGGCRPRPCGCCEE
jgi:LytS/YehU family sensor histidine kinase